MSNNQNHQLNRNGNNNISKKRQRTAEKIIIALKEAKGLLTLASRKAGVSYTTINRYANEFPSVREAVEEAKETMLDFAEGKLFEKINKGDTVAILFYLKTQGKRRGYIERQELSGEGGGAIKHEVKIQVISPKAKELTEKVLKGEGT